MPKTSIYRRIFLKAWQISWQNKFLWIFGFFAICAGNVGIYEFLIKSFYKISEQGEFSLTGTNLFWQIIILLGDKTKTYLAGRPSFILIPVLSTLLLLIFLAILIWISTVSKGALFNCAKKIAKKEKTDFQEGWQVGNQFFWPLFGLNLLAKGLAVAFLVLLIIPAAIFLKSANSLNLFTFIISFVIFAIFALLVSFLTIYASCNIVLEKKKFFEAIISGWNLLARHWLASIELAIFLFIISFVVGLGYILLFILTAIPSILLLVIFNYLTFPLGFWLTIGFCTLFWLALLVAVGSWLTTFQYASWTLFFIELNKKRTLSKLLRFVGIKT